MYRSPKFDAGKPVLHSVDVGLYRNTPMTEDGIDLDYGKGYQEVGKNIPMSATFTHAGD